MSWRSPAFFFEKPALGTASVDVYVVKIARVGGIAIEALSRLGRDHTTGIVEMDIAADALADSESRRARGLRKQSEKTAAAAPGMSESTLSER